MEKITVEKTTLDNVFLIKPYIFEDHRGLYIKTYDFEEYSRVFLSYNIPKFEFIEDDISISTLHVIKGIHGSYSNTWKLVGCLYGKIYVVVINYDEKSKQFGQWQSFILSDKNFNQILIPPKFGNGHLCLDQISIFSYKQSTYYDRSKQFTIKYNDERFNIWWPCKDPILSMRDS